MKTNQIFLDFNSYLWNLSGGFSIVSHIIIASRWVGEDWNFALCLWRRYWLSIVIDGDRRWHVIWRSHIEAAIKKSKILEKSCKHKKPDGHWSWIWWVLLFDCVNYRVVNNNLLPYAIFNGFWKLIRNNKFVKRRDCVALNHLTQITACFELNFLQLQSLPINHNSLLDKIQNLIFLWFFFLINQTKQLRLASINQAKFASVARWLKWNKKCRHDFVSTYLFLLSVPMSAEQ